MLLQWRDRFESPRSSNGPTNYPGRLHRERLIVAQLDLGDGVTLGDGSLGNDEGAD